MNKKIGRNDPCSCGSGKKYKNCCMKKEQEQTAAKYTPAGKRKFKAKLITIENKSADIFSRSASIPPILTSSETLERMKFRMTESDFRTEAEEKIAFQFPEATEVPEAREMHLPRPEDEFTLTDENFQKKSDEEEK